MNSLEFRRYEQSLLLLYKCIKGNRPSYISDFFKFRVSHSNLRGGGCNLIPRGGGVLPYMGHIGMCRCEGYGIQAVYSSIGYINQSVWV